MRSREAQELEWDRYPNHNKFINSIKGGWVRLLALYDTVTVCSEKDLSYDKSFSKYIFGGDTQI